MRDQSIAALLLVPYCGVCRRHPRACVCFWGASDPRTGPAGCGRDSLDVCAAGQPVAELVPCPSSGDGRADVESEPDDGVSAGRPGLRGYRLRPGCPSGLVFACLGLGLLAVVLYAFGVHQFADVVAYACGVGVALAIADRAGHRLPDSGITGRLLDPRPLSVPRNDHGSTPGGLRAI